MHILSLQTLVIFLFLLICLSAFFSSSETGMMSLNRYKLKHQAKQNRYANEVLNLLKRPDRLLGVILIGNTFANILASAIATLIGIRLFGEYGIVIATISLTLIVLVMAEILPKTLAALHPEIIAYAAAIPLKILLFILYPIVWLANFFVNNVLKMVGVKVQKTGKDALSLEELYTVVNEASKRIPSSHKTMLLRILELEKVNVEDIMVARQEVVGIDLEDEFQDIEKQLAHIQHRYLPVFKGDLNNVVGVLHTRRLIGQNNLTQESLQKMISEVYFVPISVPLHTQLLNFQHHKKRFGLCVDEYGDIMGLVTLEDILEEIVGEFTTEMHPLSEGIKAEKDGSFIIDGTITIRDLNRALKWGLPVDGAKTLSGAIIEHLETIPEIGTCILLNRYPIEVMQVLDNTVRTARIKTRLKEKEK